MGTYRAGETWLEPAGALVVLITNDAALPELDGE
jgi:hypothetical protein